MKTGSKILIGVAIFAAISGVVYGAYVMKPEIFGRKALMSGIVRRYDLINKTGKTKEELFAELDKYSTEDLQKGFDNINSIAT